MVNTMGKGPIKGRPLQGQGSRKVHKEPGYSVQLEATMGKHPVIAEGDSNAAGEAIQANQKGNAGPTELKERCYGANVHQHQKNKNRPVDMTQPKSRWVEIVGFEVWKKRLMDLVHE